MQFLQRKHGNESLIAFGVVARETSDLKKILHQ